MQKRVAIVGIGQTKCDYNGNGYSIQELMYLATKQAMNDAGISREDIGSAVTAQLDLLEGWSLCQQYTLDSIGGVMKPCDQRVGEDGIYAIFAGYMDVMSQIGRIAVVASVQKASDQSKGAYPDIFASSLDPIYVRQLFTDTDSLAGLEYCMAAMEARRYMHCYGITETHLAKVAAKNYNNAVRNPLAQHKQKTTAKKVLDSELLSWPLRSSMVAKPGDGACTLVLAPEEMVFDLTDKPIWIRGIGWCSQTNYPAKVELGNTDFIRIAARQAYSMAGIKHPARELDLAEVYDNYAFKELQHCEALGLCNEGEGGKFIDEGLSNIGGRIPVNPSGGLLGHGNPVGAAGLMRVAQAAMQLRDEAGDYQVSNAETAVAQSCQWPSRSGGVVVLSRW